MADAEHRESREAPEAPSPPSPSDNEPMLFCPVCSKRLSELKCKLYCQQCGYYLSCADYY